MMAEPPAVPGAVPPEAAGAQAGGSWRDVLLATKLHVPGPRPGFVPRARLAEQLDAGLGRGLVLVCAPAGYGKTALLADWARSGQRPASWLSLDAGDNDPARFWRHAVAALERVRPEVGGRVGALLGPPAPASVCPARALPGKGSPPHEGTFPQRAGGIGHRGAPDQLRTSRRPKPVRNPVTVLAVPTLAWPGLGADRQPAAR